MVLTNQDPDTKAEEIPNEKAEISEVTVEPVEEEKVEEQPNPEPEVKKTPEVLKKPNPYVRPAVSLPKEEPGRRPRNIPRYR